MSKVVAAIGMPTSKELTHWNDPDAGKNWGQEEKGMTEDEMVGWHHRLNGHGFGWTLGVGDGQGGLACCSSWGCKESDTTERLNWTEPAENQYFSGTKLLKVSIVSELNVCQWCSYKIWLSFSLLTNELDNRFVYSAFGDVTSRCFCLFFCWNFYWAWLVHRWILEWLYDIPLNTSHLSVPLTAACLVHFQPFVITNNAAWNILVQVSLGGKRCPLKWNGWVLECVHIQSP